MVCLWYTVGIYLMSILTSYIPPEDFLPDGMLFIYIDVIQFLGTVFKCMPFIIIFVFGIFLFRIFRNRQFEIWEYISLFICGGCFALAYIFQIVRNNNIANDGFWGKPSSYWFITGMIILYFILKSVVRHQRHLVRWITAAVPTFYLMTRLAGMYGRHQLVFSTIFLILTVIHTKKLIEQID